MLKIYSYLYKSVMLLLISAFALTASAQADRKFIRNGNRLYRQQQFAKAEAEYRKALSANSRNTQASYNLGCALLQQQKDSAAIAQFENAGKAETSKRRKAMAYHNMGVICQKHQMFSEAIEAYKESLRNNPSDNETRYNLELCRRQLKNQKKNDKNQNKNKKEDKNKDKQKEQQQKQDKKQNDKQQKQQQPQQQMSKENAEQMLNAAMQEEKATQQKLKQKQQQPQRRKLDQNW